MSALHSPSAAGFIKSFTGSHHFVLDYLVEEVLHHQPESIQNFLLRQGSLSAAAHLAQAHELPLSQARIHLAQGDPSAALAVLSPWRRQVEAK